ncbi:MAG: hypothetical protein HN348_09075 [Proteobacteria bacterium]|jgi:hypothetical protein|nr:hypothetical protein [Pseudomonadota bacterium]
MGKPMVVAGAIGRMLWAITRLGTRASMLLAGLIWRHRRAIASTSKNVTVATAGAITEGARSAWDLTANLYARDADLEKLRAQLALQDAEYRKLRQDAIDLGVDLTAIGATTIGDLIGGTAVPAEVQAAYEAAYPQQAQQHSLAEFVEGRSHDELLGITAGIKGKLFEIKYVEWLNEGNLPHGYTAHLAESPTQAGWDIAIAGPDGVVCEFLQLKATDSAQYVQDAIYRYPDINVVTTDEVYEKLAMHGAADGGEIFASGMENADLTAQVSSALEGEAADIFDVPYLAIAIVAFSEFIKPDKTTLEKAWNFGARGMKTTIALSVGMYLSALTGGYWLVSVAGAMGTRWLVARGRSRRLLKRKLADLVKRNQQRLKGLAAEIEHERLRRRSRWLRFVDWIVGRRPFIHA